MTDHTCRLCHSGDLTEMVDLGKLPIAHRLLDRPEQDEETFPFVVYSCPHCGLVQIADPIDPAILYGSYNYNFSSWKPEPHMPDELDLFCRDGVPASVAEIGCNDGRFLSELAERGVGLRIGIEPNPVSGAIARERGHNVFAGMVTPELVGRIVAEHGQVQAVVSRQVFEHVLDIDNFFACADQLLAPGGMLFLDLPDFEPAFRQADASLLWEEHVSYFTQPVLLATLARHGFAATDVRKYDFSGGTIAVRAVRTKAPAPASDLGEIRRLAEAFRDGHAAYGRRLRAALDGARAAGTQVVLYGVGCRACTVVNAHGLGPCIDVAVDDQVERQGKFMPGSRLEIRPSSLLAEGSGPIVCLLAVNNENEDKVMARVRGLTTRPVTFVTLFAPKDIHQALAQIEAR